MSSDAMHLAQESAHGPDHDYAHGSPHLTHPGLRAWVVGTMLDAVRSSPPAGRPPRVLEVGAGHGSLTEEFVATGAEVVVTEISGPSAEVLRRRFADRPAVTVLHDPHSELRVHGEFDAVVYVSVLHHIPDYLAAVGRAAGALRPGGTFVSFQDPLWYSRRTRTERRIDRAVYLSWRLGQGELRRGVRGVLRRRRGEYDESEHSDMVEYHIVRDGVDEQALLDLLRPRFDEVRLLPYWSTQPSWGQNLGRRLLPPNTFGVVATGRRPRVRPAGTGGCA